MSKKKVSKDIDTVPVCYLKYAVWNLEKQIEAEPKLKKTLNDGIEQCKRAINILEGYVK